MAVSGSFPWQREPTSRSSQKSKIAILILCRSNHYLQFHIKYQLYIFSLSGLLIVVFCIVLVAIEKSEVHHAGLLILLVSIAISLVCLILYLSYLPRSIGSVYFMVMEMSKFLISFFSTDNFSRLGSTCADSSGYKYMDQHISYVSTFICHLAKVSNYSLTL